MGERASLAARRIQSFVDHPVTNLLKGLTLFWIGISEASRTLNEDVSHGNLRLGHGLIIIGLFAILGSLPHLIDSIAASGRYLELRSQANRQENDKGKA